jgi:uncharacterized membrane protein
MALRPRPVAVVAVGLAYLIASQWLMTRTPPSPWSAVVLLTPTLGLIALGAWRSGHRLWSLGALGALGALGLQAATGAGLGPERLYLLQHVAIHLALALLFGATLRPGARALISRLAERLHGLTPAMERYTRKVTVAWTVYFVGVAALSLLLYASLPFAAWATFANLGTPITLLAMFAGEYLLRYRLHPEFERATMQDAIRAWRQMNRPAPPPATGPQR